jgi:hypothetical protein
MLITWEKYVCVYDEEGNEQEVAVPAGIVVPDCCETVQKYLTVVLSYRWGDLSDEQAFTEPDLPPLPEDADWKAKISRMVNNVGEPIPGKTRFDVAKPVWETGIAVDVRHALSIRPDVRFSEQPPPTFCPHCGTPLPEIERRPPEEIPGPVHRPVADGDHCGTCGERSRCCSCMDPAVAWKTVTRQEQQLRALDDLDAMAQTTPRDLANLLGWDPAVEVEWDKLNGIWTLFFVAPARQDRHARMFPDIRAADADEALSLAHTQLQEGSCPPEPN